MWDVISFGSATVDAFAKAKGDFIKIIGESKEVDMLAFRAGSKFIMQKPIHTLGGGGTNVAVGLSYLGIHVAYFGKVGKGHNGNLVIDRLKQAHVDTSILVRTKDQKIHTGFSIVLDNMDKDRVILAYKGANDFIYKKDVPIKKLDARWFYLGSFMGESFNTIKMVASIAKKRKIRVLFNPSSYLVKKGVGHLRSIIKATEVFVCNKEEARTLTDIEDLDKTFSFIHSLGPKIVVITDGKKGVSVSDGKTVRSIKSRKVKVVDSTGAGDAFCAGFLAGLIKKDDIEFAMKLGMLNGASVVQEIGAKNGLLKYSAALKKIKNPRKIKRRALRI